MGGAERPLPLPARAGPQSGDVPYFFLISLIQTQMKITTMTPAMNIQSAALKPNM